MSDKRPIICLERMDWVDYTCPCGETFCTRWAADGEARAWKIQHAPHSDGTILYTPDDDWVKVWATRPPDRIYKIEGI